MEEDEIFMGIEMHCMEKRSGFSQVAEDATFSFPKLLMVHKNDRLSDIYVKVF